MRWARCGHADSNGRVVGDVPGFDAEKEDAHRLATHPCVFFLKFFMFSEELKSQKAKHTFIYSFFLGF